MKGKRAAEDEGVTTWVIKTGNSSGVCWRKCCSGMCLPDVNFPQQKRNLLAWFNAHWEPGVYSLAQPPKEAFAVAEQILLWHVETQTWELTGSEIT